MRRHNSYYLEEVPASMILCLWGDTLLDKVLVLIE